MPGQRRNSVHWAIEDKQISQRRSCRVLGQARTTQRRQLRGRSVTDARITQRLIELADEGAPTSQFERRIRAICGWALGDTTPRGRVEMVNLLGDDWMLWEHYARQPEANVHLYGKTESRPGRKMGRVTIVERTEIA